MVSTSKDGTARVWNIVEGRCERVFRNHNAWVNRAAISPDGKWVLTSSDDSTVRLWELANGRESLELRRPSYSVAVTFISGGKQLIINHDADMEVLPFEPDLWSSDPQRVLSEAEKEVGMRLDGMTMVPLQ